MAAGPPSIVGGVFSINKVVEQDMTGLLLGPEINGFSLRFYYRVCVYP